MVSHDFFYGGKRKTTGHVNNKYSKNNVEFLKKSDLSTRGNLFKPRARTEIRSKFFSHRIINAWNQLPEDIANCQDIDHFKQELERVIPDDLYIVK